MNQYTITEKNAHERETFSYVMDLTDEQAKLISEKIPSLKGSSGMKIEKTKYTDEEIRLIGESSSNTYMSRIAKYSFIDPKAVENWSEFGELFYKGNGLVEVN